MSAQALASSPGLREILIAAIEGSFLAYIALSFLVVAVNTVRLFRSGRLLTFSPLPAYSPPAWMGGLLIFALLTLAVVPVLFPAVVLAAVGYLGAADPMILEQLGLRRLPLRRVVAWSLALCGAVIFVEIPLTWGLDDAMTFFHVPHPDQATVVMFRGFTKWTDISSFIFVAVVYSPILEEIFFRGLLFNFLKRRLRMWPAIVLSAAIFACAHVTLGATLQLGLLGVVLAVAYQQTGSLLLSIGTHACFNLVTALSILLEKGGP